jgi:DNA-binding GntR family transcriptional regulator
MTEPLPDHNLADAVADRLRADIRSGVYAPGDRLVERRLAHRFGVSHIPLREALARLGEEGLVVRPPRRGARVASLSPRMLEEVSSLRVVLEQFATRRVQGRFTPVARAELQAIVDKMIRASEQQDLAQMHELDQAFHEYLWRLTDHALPRLGRTECAATRKPTRNCSTSSHPVTGGPRRRQWSGTFALPRSVSRTPG